MAKGKVKSAKAGGFAKGGAGHMFGKQAAGPQKAGGTAHAVKGDGGKAAKGGSGHMFGYSPSVPQRPGRTSAR